MQDLVPILKKGAADGGSDVEAGGILRHLDIGLLAAVRQGQGFSGAQYLIVILSHASSDMFVKQWYDAQVPIPIGGIDVKSQDADFFTARRRQGQRETVGMLRDPRAADAEDHSVLG